MTVTVNIQRDGSRAQVDIAGDMSIYDASELKHKLFSEFVHVQEMEIDLGEVAEIDTSGLQLLMLLKREARAAGKKLQLISHSAAVLEVLELLRMDAYFGDPLVITAKK